MKAYNFFFAYMVYIFEKGTKFDNNPLEKSWSEKCRLKDYFLNFSKLCRILITIGLDMYVWKFFHQFTQYSCTMQPKFEKTALQIAVKKSSKFAKMSIFEHFFQFLSKFADYCLFQYPSM